MAKVVHSMIRVLDADRSMAFYRKAFGLKPVSRHAFESFELIYLANDKSTFEVELTVNKGRTEPYNLGDGYGHAAFVVDNIDTEHARFMREGLNPGQLREMPWDGRPFAKFFFVSDPDGYKIEVLQRFGRFN
jgi:lactoylglutathione lyase